MSKCRTTHHNACDCREEKFAEMQKRVEELEAREKKLVDALRFYGDRDNWTVVSETIQQCSTMIVGDDHDNYILGNKHSFTGGRVARDTLKELGIE